MMYLDFAHARPFPAIACLAAATLFLLQGLRYLRKTRSEQRRVDSSPRRLKWFRGSMAAGFVLAAAWIVLLGLELRYPDPPESIYPRSSPPLQEVLQ